MRPRHPALLSAQTSPASHAEFSGISGTVCKHHMCSLWKYDGILLFYNYHIEVVLSSCFKLSLAKHDNSKYRTFAKRNKWTYHRRIVSGNIPVCICKGCWYNKSWGLDRRNLTRKSVLHLLLGLLWKRETKLSIVVICTFLHLWHITVAAREKINMVLLYSILKILN